MIGQTISHYKILEKLGQGGMGVVYKAEDTKLKRTVALKFLPRDLMIDASAKKRFHREAQAAASILHPNVCTIYEVEEFNSQTFIVMEYLKGQNLKEMIGSRPVAIDQALKYTVQVARGLQKAHEQEIIHRDIKSANIIITDEDHAKILDFGLAKIKRQTQTTKEGTIKGTIDYMSPEQTLGDPLDHRTDIWSLGVVLYEMLSGQLPFQGFYEQAVMFSIMNEEPEPLTALRTGIPMELERIVCKTLAKDPGERYQHLDDLIVDLEKVKSLPKSRVSVSKKSGLFRTMDRMIKPVRVPTIILVIAFLAIGGYLFFREFQKKGTREQPVSITRTSKNKIVILPFANLTGDKKYDNWRTAIQQCMIIDLYQSKYLNVLSSPVLIGLLSELHLLNKTNYTDKELKEIASRSNATDILQGNLTKAGNSLRINLVIQETGSLGIRETVKAAGSGDESFHAMIDALTPKIKSVFKLSAQEIADDIDQNAAQISSTPEALALFNQGLKQFYMGKYEESNRIFEEALAIDPEFALAYFRITVNYEYLELHDRAKEYLDKALSLSDHISARERYLIQAHAHGLFDDSFEKQIKTLKTLLEFYPDDEEGIGNLGGIYRNMEEWDLAREQFEKFLKFNPGATYENFAYIYMSRGQYEKARKTLQDNHKIFSNPAYYHYFLSTFFLCQGKFKEALRESEKSLELEPENSEYLVYQGQIQLLKGRFQEAENIFRRLINQKDAYPQYLGHGSLSYLHLTRGQYEKSRQQTKSAIKLLKKMGQKNIELKYILFLSYLHIQSKNFSQALRETNQALELASYLGFKSYRMFCVYFQGIAHLYLDRVDQAKELAVQIKNLVGKIGKKKCIRYYYHLQGMIYQKQGQTRQSSDYFKKALLLFPAQGHELNDEALYRYPLAEVYFEQGDSENARKNYEKIISLTSGRLKSGDRYALSFYRLGKIFQLENEKQRAIGHYQKFLALWDQADPGIPEVKDARKQLGTLEKEGNQY